MKRILLGALGMLSGLGFSGTPTRPARRTFKNMRPVGAALRDPTEFYQSNALEAAVMKRRRRAEKLKLQTLGAWNNAAHVVTYPAPEGSTYRAFVPTLNPFYVAK